MNWLQLISTWILPIVSISLSAFTLLNIFGLAEILKTGFESLPKSFESIFKDPAVKHAMSIMGQHSGDARLDRATLDKFNANIGELNPIIGWVSDTLDIEPYALLRMAGQEPIKGFIEGLMKNQGLDLGGMGGNPVQNQKNNFQRAT